MDKQAAADYLGISVRTLAEEVAQGRLEQHWIEGKTRPKADYREEDLQRLKESRANRVTAGIVQNRAIPANNAENSNRAIVQKPAMKENRADNSIIKAPAILQDSGVSGTGFEQVTELLTESIREASQSWALNLSAKKVLTVEQVRELTGFSEGTIREAIKTGALKSKKIGRSTRILPADLDKWLATVFES